MNVATERKNGEKYEFFFYYFYPKVHNSDEKNCKS